ncbi:condensation domain-containing protein [Micromonospora sp. LOL_021]|uniref:condensation domain-containing protein n=1 Tax=Micromonospora sp. LOL_021 TaxID=3345417 RepID=UPI003A8BA942
MAGVWEAILGQPPDRTSDFFLSGGDSLLAAKVTERLKSVLGVRLTLDLLFDHRRLTDYVAAIEAHRRENEGIGGDTLTPVPRDGDLPLSALQQNRLLREARNLREGRKAPSFVVPVAVEVAAPLDDADLTGALHRVVKAHEALRTGFRLDVSAGTATPIIVEDITLDVAVHDLGDCPVGDRTVLLRQIQSELLREPLPRDAPPLLRAAIARFTRTNAVLLLAVDHLVFDGWSAEVLLSALAEDLSGRHAQPSALQFIDWVAWQRRQLSGARWEQQLAYWRSKLAGTQPFPPLSLPAPAASVGSHRCCEAAVSIDGTTEAGLRKVARDAGATMFMTVLTAVAAAWQRASGDADVVVHSPTANRTGVDVEQMIGWFAHSIVLRLRPDVGAPGRSRLVQVRQQVLEALLHQDIPLPMLVKALQPDSFGRAARPARLFYAYEPYDDAQWSVPGGWLRRLQFDEVDSFAEPGLSFFVRQNGGGGLTVRIVFNQTAVDPGFVDSLAQGIAAELDELALEGQ